MTNSYCTAACPIGQYCVMGSTSGRNCPAGTMAATASGLSAASLCVPCANGYTCPARSGPVGSARSPAICGSSGSTLLYCSGGSRNTPAAGYFASNPASAGSNTFTAQTKCPAGSYCPGNGRKVLCPAGKYGSSTGVSSSNCQGNCAAGYNCPAGSTGQFSQSCAPNPTNTNSARTFYCPAGQGRQTINTATEYTTPETGQPGFRTGKARCAAGEFCSNGKRQRRIKWTGQWASCAPSEGGTATFVVAEGNDANADTVIGDYTEIIFTASTPTSLSVRARIYGGSNRCTQSWTDDANGAGLSGQQTVNFVGQQFRIKSTGSGGMTDKIVLNEPIKNAGGTNMGGLDFEACRPTDGYSLLIRAGFFSAGGYTEDCRVTIRVGDVNEKPVIPIGQTFTIAENSEPQATCDGGRVTASDSEVSDGLQDLTWTINSGCNPPPGQPCPFVIGVCDGQIRVATEQYFVAAALDFEGTVWPSTYTLQIKANDDGPGGGQFDIKPVTVVISDVNEPPSIFGSADGGTSFSVSEFANHGTVVVGNGGKVAASDVDTLGGHDAQLTFVHHNAGSVLFSVSAVGVVSVDLTAVSKLGSLNFEAPQKVHDLVVSCTDSGWGSTPPKPLSTSSVIITVQVLDENDPPIIGDDDLVAWSGNVATDTVLVFPEDCNGAASISAAGTALPSCTKQLTQTDPDDTTTGADDTAAFNSNSNGWTITDDCSGQFGVSSRGELSLVAPIDYEAAVLAGNDPIYCTVTVRVQDQTGGTGGVDTMVIGVKIADVNETPFGLDKVAAPGRGADADCWTYEDALPNTIACGLTSKDPDTRASPSAQTHTYSKTGGDGNSDYAVYKNPASVALFGSSSPPAGVALGASIILVGQLNYEQKSSYTLDLAVSDAGFQQPLGLSFVKTLTITVKDVNEAPSFVAANLQQARSVSECTSVTPPPNSVSKACDGTDIVNRGRNAIGAVLTSTDLDTSHASFGWTASSHQFSLAPATDSFGDAQDLFTMGLTTGQLAVKLGAALDFEEQASVTLHVLVTDQNIGGGPAYHPAGVPIQAKGQFNVAVTNINEQPIADSVGPFYFTKFSPVNTLVGTLTATDVDDVGLSTGCCFSYVYRSLSTVVSGSDAVAVQSDLAINPTTGKITVQRYDIDSSSLDPTTYILTVVVDDHPSDSEKLTSASIDVQVEVVEENNKPVVTGLFTGAVLKVPENSQAGVAVLGGSVQCTDSEVDRPCTPADNIACNSAASTKGECDSTNQCEWKTSKCMCRRQKLEFFAILDDPPGTTAEGDPLPIMFGFKSGSNSDVTEYYDNGAGGTGNVISGTLFTHIDALNELDYETYTSHTVTYGCRDTGFRAGATPSDPMVGWMESTSVEKVTIEIQDVNEEPMFTVVGNSEGIFVMQVDEMDTTYLAMTENFESLITCGDPDAKAGGGDTTDDVVLVLKTSDNAISEHFIIEKGDCEPGTTTNPLLGAPWSCPLSGKRPWCRGAIIKPKIGLDFETQQTYDLKIIAQDDGRNPQTGAPGPVLSSTLPVQITVRDRNDSPLIARHGSSGATVWSVSEDAPEAFVVGTFTVSDPDIDGIIVTWRESTGGPWDTLELNIESGNTGTAFELVVVSGTGTAADPQVVELQYRGPLEAFPGATDWGLDYERQKEYNLVVRVTDSGGPSILMSTPNLPDSDNILRPAWTKTPLYAEIIQRVTVTDVDDVVLGDIAVKSASGTLSTKGGDKVWITGTNFGATWAGKQAPTLIDQDNDGDDDMWVGDNGGNLHYFENTGSKTNPVFTKRTGANNPIGVCDAGLTADRDKGVCCTTGEPKTCIPIYISDGGATPTMIDQDNDGDFDMWVGDQAGRLHYFENTGSKSNPAFTKRTGAANPLDGVTVGGQATPVMIDQDNDDDFDMWVGGKDGKLHYFENTGSKTNPVFTKLTGAANPMDGINVGGQAAPTMIDQDNDGDVDMWVGASNGKLQFFENTGSKTNPVFTERTGADNPMDGVDVGYYANPTTIDQDNDGDVDMWVGDYDGKLHYFENTGSITNPAFTKRTGADNPMNNVGTVIAVTYTNPATQPKFSSNEVVMEQTISLAGITKEQVNDPENIKLIAAAIADYLDVDADAVEIRNVATTSTNSQEGLELAYEVVGQASASDNSLVKSKMNKMKTATVDPTNTRASAILGTIASQAGVLQSDVALSSASPSKQYKSREVVMKQTISLAGITKEQVNDPEKIKLIAAAIADYLDVDADAVEIRNVATTSTNSQEGLELAYEVVGQASASDNSLVKSKMNKMKTATVDSTNSRALQSASAILGVVASQAGVPQTDVVLSSASPYKQHKSREVVMKQTVGVAGVTKAQVNDPQKIKKIAAAIADYLDVDADAIQIKDVATTSTNSQEGLELTYEVVDQASESDNSLVESKMNKMKTATGDSTDTRASAILGTIASQAGVAQSNVVLSSAPNSKQHKSGDLVMKQTVSLAGVTKAQVNDPQKIKKIAAAIADYLDVDADAIQIKDVATTSTNSQEGLELTYEVVDQASESDNSLVESKMNKMKTATGDSTDTRASAILGTIATQAGVAQSNVVLSSASTSKQERSGGDMSSSKPGAANGFFEATNCARDLYFTWTMTISSQDLTESEGVAVTQTSNSATGTLSAALGGPGTTVVSITSAVDQTFDLLADLVVGDSTVVIAKLVSVSSFLHNSRIICDSAPGFGVNQIWSLSVTGDTAPGFAGEPKASPETKISYSYPVITNVTILGGASTMNTLGGEQVLLTGTNMGIVGTEFWGDYGPTRLGGFGYCAGRLTNADTNELEGTGMLCTTTIADTQVTCTTSAGVGTLLSWRLTERKHPTWKTQEDSATSAGINRGTLDYSAPTVSDINPPPQAVKSGGLRTQGGEQVELIGTGFGSPNTNLYPCGGETEPPNGNVYAPTGPQSPVARYGPTGFEFPIRPGNNIQCSESTDTGCGALCVVFSDTRIVCTSEPAIGAEHIWTVFVAGQLSVPSNSTTKHRLPVVSILTGAGLRGGGTEGGSTVNIIGDQFGPIPPRNEKGEYLYLLEANFGQWKHDGSGWNTDVVPVFSSSCTMVTAHTRLQCVTSPGIGKNLTWTITVHGKTAQTSLPNYAKGSYAPPSLYELTATGGNNVQKGATPGGDHIIIAGKNFGPKGKSWNLPELKYGKKVGAPCESANPVLGCQTKQRFFAQNCTVTVAHVRIECDTSQGAGFSHLWEAIVGGQTNVPATTGYSEPIILNITGDGAHGADTHGNQEVLIHGENFGPTATGDDMSGPSFLESVTYGKQGTEYVAKDCIVLSHSKIRCKTAPGVGTYNVWLVKIAGQVNNILTSPVTDYAVPTCHAIVEVARQLLLDSASSPSPPVPWRTDPDTAVDRIELRCKHTGLADSLPSQRYIRYSVGGYEKHLLLDVANTNIQENYEQIRFATPSLAWSRAPSASIPVSLVLITASGEILETVPLQHTYGVPRITTEPTVAAGIPSISSTFNVSLVGINFGERGEVLRFDGWCNKTRGEVCEQGSIRRCVGRRVVTPNFNANSVGSREGPSSLCGWNIIPGVGQPFHPDIGSVFHYSHGLVKMTFKGLSGTLLVRRGGRLSQLRKSESTGVVTPPPWDQSGYALTWDGRSGCTTPLRSVATTMKPPNVDTWTDPGTNGGSGSQHYLRTECEMGQASNNVSFDALSPYITSLESKISNNNGVFSTALVYPTYGHIDEENQARLIVKCWYCLSSTAKIYIGGESVAGKIIGGRRCKFDATQPGLRDEAYANDPAKLAAIYTCDVPPGQGLQQAVWLMTMTGPSGREGQHGLNQIDYLRPKILNKEVLDMQSKPLCISSADKSSAGSNTVTNCRKVPTRGLDVQILGTNLGLYGQIIFQDGRASECNNATFGCCQGKYDPVISLTKSHCTAPYVWTNSQGHDCKVSDTRCMCRAKESCSVNSKVLNSKFARCWERDASNRLPRACLCTLSNIADPDQRGNCERCPAASNITSSGYCDGNLVPAQKVWNHNSIVFQLPSGIGLAHRIELSVSKQPDASRLFDYEPPRILSIHPRVGPTRGTTLKNNIFLTLKGTNFGNHDAEVYMGSGEMCKNMNSTQAGPDVCQYKTNVVSQNHELITVKLPPGIGRNIKIRVHVGGQSSNTDITFHYAAPEIHTIYPLHARTDGYVSQPVSGSLDQYGRSLLPARQLITIIGDNFGTVHERSRQLQIGNNIFEGVPVFSNDSMLQFAIPQGTGRNNNVSIKVGNQDSTVISNKIYLFDYDVPVVYPISTLWDTKKGNPNFPAANGKYYAPTTGCANYELIMAVLDPENPPSKRQCIASAIIIFHGENFGCCVHSEKEIKQNGISFADDCWGGEGPSCSASSTQAPRLVLTDENGLVQKIKVLSYGHYRIEAELPEGTGKSTVTVEVGPDLASNKVKESTSSTDYEEMGEIGFSYSKPQLTETKFGATIFVADTTNAFDATGSSQYGTLKGQKETQSQLFLFGDNFGASQSPTHIEVLSGYYNDGTEDWNNCSEPVWHTSSMYSSGFPYLSCYPPAVTVGDKKFRISIGSNTQTIEHTIYGRSIKGKCPSTYYGLTEEYCVKCWSYKTAAAPDSPIMLANCSGVYDPLLQVWKGGELVTVGGTTRPIARFGYSIWPPQECENGDCEKRSYKGLLPQESGISLVPDTFTNRNGGEESASCLPTFDEDSKKWSLPSMICDAAEKPGDTCHPLRAYGQYTSNPDSAFEHKERNLHAWPPHKNDGIPPLDRQNCTLVGGTWAPHVIFDRTSRAFGDDRKIPLPDACAFPPYEGEFVTAPGPDEKLSCKRQGGAWTKVDTNPSTCGRSCIYECRMPCCLSIFEDGIPKYKERTVDKAPGGKNDLFGNVVDEKDAGPTYEFLGKRPVCSRANSCEPKFSCLGSDVCLEGYTKYYEPYRQEDGDFVCQNFHYKIPGSCPSPIITWGPIRGFSQEDKDFMKTDVPHHHAYLVEEMESSASGGRRLTNLTGNVANSIEGTFQFQTVDPASLDYRDQWCDDDDENRQHCFWGTPVKVLGFVTETSEPLIPISDEQWVAVTKRSIKFMEFKASKTKNSLLQSDRLLKKLTPDTPDARVKIQMYDKSVLIVKAKGLMSVRYPSLRVSGVPNSIDPDGGNTDWCLEHPARCYWERNPHPQGLTNDQGEPRPQANMCCFAPKCTECDPSTHFRMEENCVACPKCWWCIPLAAFFILVFGSVAMHFLMKMRLNFVIISLALDHMQILGLLAGAKINWPWQIKTALKWLVFFQLDVDVAGPECLARGIVTFENKWWFKVLVPFIGMFIILVYQLVVLLLGLCCCCCRKKKKSKVKKNKKNGKKQDSSKVDQKTRVMTFMIKAFINIIACCYIMMTKAAMSIFSCFFPPGDDTGASYMVAQPSEPCWSEDGLQFALIAPAVIVIIAYSLGYPLALATMYHKNRHVIMRDQVLRAAGQGFTAKTNPDYQFRKRYGILYSYFKPSHYWWVLMFIGRKCLVCSFAVGLRNYPTFQLASMLLVMFCCLLIQVRQRPFMDTQERAELLIDLNTKKLAYANSLVVHMTVFAREHGQDLNKESRSLRKLRKKIADLEALIKSLRHNLLTHDSWWWNVNTLEELLSTGAVILMLAGITFDTTYVNNSPNVRGVIAIVMVVLLSSMLVFYIMSFSHEYYNVSKVKSKLARVEWSKVKAWQIHNFQENQLANTKTVVPVGLAATFKTLEEAKARKAQITSAGLNAASHVRIKKQESIKKEQKKKESWKKESEKILKKHPSLKNAAVAEAAKIEADALFADADEAALATLALATEEEEQSVADSLFDDEDGMEDFFEMFGEETEGVLDMGFDLNDLFSDACVYDGTAEAGLDFMNTCMEPVAAAAGDKSAAKSGEKQFNLDLFLQTGMTFEKFTGVHKKATLMKKLLEKRKMMAITQAQKIQQTAQVHSDAHKTQLLERRLAERLKLKARLAGRSRSKKTAGVAIKSATRIRKQPTLSKRNRATLSRTGTLRPPLPPPVKMEEMKKTRSIDLDGIEQQSTPVLEPELELRAASPAAKESKSEAEPEQKKAKQLPSAAAFKQKLATKPRRNSKQRLDLAKIIKRSVAL